MCEQLHKTAKAVISMDCYKYRAIKFLVLTTLILAGSSLSILHQFPWNSSEIAYASRLEEPTQQNLPSTNIYLPIIQIQTRPVMGSVDWYMTAANPQRTSWISNEVPPNLHLKWYRPIEAYIPQNVQVIASNGLLYISTARGLYALNADNGSVVWRFDTELPLGNSPTVMDSVVYVGGYDRKLHALDAINGTHFWEFSGAGAGFDTNPLVVDGMVIAGNRDGYMYAIGAHRTSRQGQLIWKFKTNGSIHLSSAYQNGVVYFASDDNYAYALQANTGSLIWKSSKLPGDGFHSWWPVIFRDKVIFSAATGYRNRVIPGTLSVTDASGQPYDSVDDMDRDAIFPGDPDGELVGPLSGSESWTNGYPVIDASSISEYYEDNPNYDQFKHKPWRRTTIMLNLSNGREYTFNSDNDNYPEYIPIARAGGDSGNRYPPIVGPDGILYQSNVYQKFYLPQIRVMGWKYGTSDFSLLKAQGAIDEPSALSGGGNIIYRNLCCDRVGDWFSIINPSLSGTLWDYNTTLEQLAPGYDNMWTVLPTNSRMLGWYKGNTSSINGIYHNHGDQNPIIPYRGNLYTHRSNAIIAFGSQPGPGALPVVTIRAVNNTSNSPTYSDLIANLETEIEKMLDRGHLRPGYYNNGTFNVYSELADYFNNPGDTLYTLALAYPYLSSELQSRTAAYLRSEFQTYFDPNMYSTIGWNEGAPRESMPLPPETEASIASLGPEVAVGPRFSWPYPQQNFYGLWKYAQIFPADVERVYQLAKNKVVAPVPSIATTDYFTQKPYELNAYIAGYYGFIELQRLAKMDSVDTQLRTTVNSELNRLLQLRVNIFTKDTYWVENNYHKRHLNISRNFMFLVPELGNYLNQHDLAEVTDAVEEYDYIAPYWFVSRFNAVVDEGVMANLYDTNALFLAKAYILKQSRSELVKYLDIPGFEAGDLFYIQNLLAALAATP